MYPVPRRISRLIVDVKGEGGKGGTYSYSYLQESGETLVT